jgi:hypothetical protein
VSCETRLLLALEVVFIGRTSSMPVALVVVPMPNRLATTSSSASVEPEAISIVLWLPVCVPSVPEGVKLSEYFIVFAVRLVMRMSDSNSESFAPCACPTTGKISASGGGVPLPAGDTGVTRLIETGMVLSVVAFVCGPLAEAVLYVIFTVPVFVPRLSTLGSAVTVSVIPSAGSAPDDGDTVSHGLSTVATKVVGSVAPGRKSVCTTFPSAPTSVLELFVRTGVTKTPTRFEYGPRWSLQSLTPRTR